MEEIKKIINASNKLNGCDFIISDMTSIKNIKSTITKIKKKYKSFRYFDL